MQYYTNSNSLKFGFVSLEPSQDELALLTQHLLHPTSYADTTPNASEVGPLAGRRVLTRITLPTLGDFVVKTYERGGVWRFLVKRHYLNAGCCRAERELSILARVKAHGLNVPEPIGFVQTTGVLCRNWLLMREIRGATSIAQLAINSDVSKFLDQFILQVRIMVEDGLLHVDLHPGNVLVDPEQRVYLIDFDKARNFKGTASDLRRAYICRWRRAVIKHGLPEILSEYVSAGLLQR